jgi:hypothetical protein
MLNPRPMDKTELADFLSGGEPETMEYFKANVSDGFDNSTLGVAYDKLKETFADPSIKASDKQAQENINAYYEKRKPEVVDEASPQLKTFSVDDWKKSEHFREGIQFQDGWSEGRAKYLAQSFDERKQRDFILERGRNSDKTMFGSGLVGQMVGGLPDPINLIPFGGTAGKGAKIGEKLLRAGIEGAAGNLAVSAVTRPYWERRGTDSDFQDYVNDVFIGGAMGSGFGLLGHGVSKVKERRANANLKERQVMGQAGSQAVDAMAKGEDFDPSQVPGLKETHDSIYDLKNIKHSEKVVQVESELINLGMHPEEARESIAPMMAHVNMIAEATGKTFDQAFEEFGASFQAAKLEGDKVISIPPEEIRKGKLIESELSNMAEEIRMAEVNTGLVDTADGGKNRFYDNSFPEWYREAGVKNQEHLSKVLESKTGPVYERLKAIAQDRLTNGYESPVHGRVQPDTDFASLQQSQHEIPAGPDGEPLFQSAYHGTPHKFDKFSTEHIGKGEGAQAYGWGLYFAEDKNVSEWYRKKLSKPEFTTIFQKGDQKVDLLNPDKQTLDRFWKEGREFTGTGKYSGDTLRVISVDGDVVKSKIVFSLLDDTQEKIGQVVESKLSDKPVGSDLSRALEADGYKRNIEQGQLYKVDVPEKDLLLDWDKEFKDQPDNVKKALLKVFEAGEIENYRTGQDLYQELSSIKGGDREASMALKEAGVPGLKYLDGATRKKIGGDQKHNFVVFDESHVKVEETYYKKSTDKDRGAIQFQKEGKAVISLFKDADRSTILHETGHLFLNNLERLSKLEGVDPRIKADLEKAYGFMGLKPGEKIQRAHHEKFAEGFEQFLREGRAPRPELDGVFARFKDWLMDIYKSLDSFKTPLSDDAREVYSNLLGGDSKRLAEVPTSKVPVTEPTLQADQVSEMSMTDLEALANATPGLISPEELSGFKNVMTDIEKESKALDEVVTFFQGAKTDKDLLDAANRAGMLKDDFQKIIDSFNEKLLREADQKLGLSQLVEQEKIALAMEAKELKRQAFLAGEARAKGIAHVEKIISSGGGAKESVLSILEGTSSLRGVEGAGNSVDGSYTALAQSVSSKCFTELRSIDKKIEDLFSGDIQFNQNVAKEMMKPGSSGDEVARKAGEILSRYSEDLRQRANLAGATIGKLEGHVPRTHDVEKLIGKENEWVNFMMDNLDPERSFVGLSDAQKKEALRETFRSLLTGEHGDKPEIDTAIPMRRPARNIAKKMGESRSLHFKSAEVEVSYLKQFGQGDNILQSMASHYENMSRKIALMERLGPNPESTVSYLVDKIRTDIKEKKLMSHLDDEKTVKMLDDLGTSGDVTSRDSDIGHAVMQALGEVSNTQGFFKNFSRVTRAVNSLSKLGSALLSQPTDFVHAVNERRLMSDDNLAKIWGETFKDYFSNPSPEMREVLDHVGLFVDAINYKNFNKFDADNINNKLARANDWMFRWSGQNWHVKHSKNAVAISLSKELGTNISKAWKDVHPGLKEMLTQYGSFNEKKWEMLRKAEPLMVDGKAYYHPGMIEKIPDDVFIQILPDDLKASPEAIKRERFKLEMDLKTFFVEEGRNAAPEPDAKIRRIMAFGTKSGTMTNEAVKLLTQFKTFAFVNYDRSIKGKRMMKDPNDYGGLVHHAVATLALGYVSTVLKDLVKGLEPADPQEGKTWMRAAFQSGGLGIMGDFVQAGVSSRSGADALTSLMGPTFATAGNLTNLAGKTIRGDGIDNGYKLTSQWLDFGRSLAPAPFSTLWYTRAAMDYLVWHQLKETLEPGSIRRSEGRLRKEYNQKYLMSPMSLR